MDTHKEHPKQRLIETALTTLQQHGIKAKLVAKKLPRTPDADATIQIDFGREQVLYPVEVRRGLRPAHLGGIIHQFNRYDGQIVLVADYVTPQMADDLRTRNINFLDTAGNAYFNHPPLLIWIKGQRLADPIKKTLTGRAFQASGLQLLFVLLSHPEWTDRPYRELGKLAGIAHGTVGWVMAELPKLGFILEQKGGRRLVQKKRLLQQWVEIYANTLRPRLILGRFTATKTNWWPKVEPQIYGMVMGGEPAAAKLTQNIKPGMFTLYGPKVEPGFVLDHRLKKDTNGEVEILRRFWAFDNTPPDMAPAVLIYADLLATGNDRNLETAGLIYDQYLAEHFKND